jgi:excisionase family DNA binding protein
MKAPQFDPLAYIENAFLDRERGPLDDGDLAVNLPNISDYLANGVLPSEKGPRTKFRKTEMSAPRPRRSKSQAPQSEIDPELKTAWEALPKNVAFLISFYDDQITKNYYRGEFRETRQDLIRRLLDPELSLEETSRLLGVCPATVRRYTNRGWLAHHRTEGGQRRFRLSQVVQFVEEHGRFPEA